MPLTPLFFHAPLPSWSVLAGFFLLLLVCARAEPVTLEAFQGQLGWTSRTVRADCVDIGDGTNRLRLFPGLRRTEYNGVAVWLHAPTEAVDTNALTLDKIDIDGVLLPILQPPPPKHRPMRVMLDPGHGGEDGGALATNRKLQEKDLVLDLAIRIGEKLKAAGMAVAFTRHDDTFLSLAERTETATVWRADALVSLHANFAINPLACGRETYVLPVAGYEPTGGASSLSTLPRLGNNHDVLNNLLGFCIHRQLPGRLHADDRGLRRARFQVLRQAPCPAALVEIGFLSNAKEAKLLASGWYRDRLARAIAAGLIDFSRYQATDAANSLTRAADVTNSLTRAADVTNRLTRAADATNSLTRATAVTNRLTLVPKK